MSVDGRQQQHLADESAPARLHQSPPPPLSLQPALGYKMTPNNLVAPAALNWPHLYESAWMAPEAYNYAHLYSSRPIDLHRRMVHDNHQLEQLSKCGQMYPLPGLVHLARDQLTAGPNLVALSATQQQHLPPDPTPVVRNKRPHLKLTDYLPQPPAESLNLSANCYPEDPKTKFIKLSHQEHESQPVQSHNSNITHINSNLLPPVTSSQHQKVNNRHSDHELYYIIIERHKVAAFYINDEPHLCLPQLLQFLKRHFSIQKIIEEFEASLVNFVSASPKQVAILVEANILPPNAQTCPLVRHSAADRVCLNLFGLTLNPTKKDLLHISSRHALPAQQHMLQDQKQEDHNQSDAQQHSSNNQSVDKEQHQQSDSNVSSSNAPQNYSQPNPLKQTTSEENFSRTTEDDSSSSSSKVLMVGKPNRSSEPLPSLPRSQVLFESQPHSFILNMASAVSSTLMIRIYHRCFGKCRGLYFPSLLKDSSSECIACEHCHIMLSPRRFIGHVHGVKEKHVCHWGFNSYNWPFYIRLSRKQTMNSLDDDELMAQFKNLQCVTEVTDELDDTVENVSEAKINPTCHTFKPIQTDLTDRSETSSSSFNKEISVPKSSLHSAANDHKQNFTSPSTNDYLHSLLNSPRRSSENLSEKESNNKAILLKEDEKKQCNILGEHLDTGTTKKALIDYKPDVSSYSVHNNKHTSDGNNENSLIAQSLISLRKVAPSAYSCASINRNQNRSHHQVSKSDNQSSGTISYKRENYISNQLSKYLESQGLGPALSFDIVQNTIQIIRDSQLAFT